MLVAQQDHGGDDRDGQGDKRFTEESQHRLNGRQGRHDLGNGVGDNQNQRNQDDADDGAELGQLAFVNVSLIGNRLRNGDKVLVATDFAPDGTGNDHGKDAAEDTNQNDPAEINTQHRCDQHGAGRWRNERMTDRQTGQQRDGVEQRGTVRALCQRESQRDQDDKARVKEHRHGDDKTCDAQRPGGFFVTEFAYHRDSQRLCAA